MKNMDIDYNLQNIETWPKYPWIKIILLNCHWFKPNFNELLILLPTLNSTVVWLQETFLPKNDNYKIKNYEQWYFIHKEGL